MTVKIDAENIRDSIVRLIDECAKSGGKKVLVLWSKDREESFVPEDKGLCLHQDTFEFIDTDGTHTVLPFSSIARIELDEEPVLPAPKIQVDGGATKVVRFRAKHQTRKDPVRAKGGHGGNDMSNLRVRSRHANRGWEKK